MKYVQKPVLKKNLCALQVHAHAHSLEGTLVMIIAQLYRSII